MYFLLDQTTINSVKDGLVGTHTLINAKNIRGTLIHSQDFHN